MNKQKNILLGTAVLFISSSFLTLAQAQPYYPYFSANVGIALPLDAETTDTTEPGLVLDLGFDNNVSLTGAFGLRGGKYRSELEIGYQKHDLNDISASGVTVNADSIGTTGSIKAVSGLVNAYYDFETGTALRPFITGGIGYSRVDVSLSIDFEDELDTSDDDTAFTFQLGAGIGYAVSETATLELRYRYFSIGKLEFDTTRSELRSHNLSAGLRMSF